MAFFFNLISNCATYVGNDYNDENLEDIFMKKSVSAFVRTKAWVFLAAAMLPFASASADFPDRPVGLMVAYSPGGATDFQARIATLASAKEKDGKALYIGQPVYIINKPGAGGQVGWNWFAEKAPKDGYMMAAYNVPHFIAQSIRFKTKYNVDNLEPIANWGADPAVLIVSKNSEFKTATDLVDYAKANPGKVTLSGAGKFVGHHIAMLQLQKASGTKLKYVPTKGGVNAMKMVKGDQVKGGFNNLSDSFRAQGDIRILAVADLERHEFLPDVPTFKELGIDVDNSSVNFRGIMVPKGTPQDVIDTLAAKVPGMLEDDRVLKNMKKTGSPVRVMSRAEVQAMWKKRVASLTELLSGLEE